MQAKKRYLLVLLSVAFLLFCYFGGLFRRKKLKINTYELVKSVNNYKGKLRNFSHWPVEEDRLKHGNHKQLYTEAKRFYYSIKHGNGSENCRMETCFDFSRCAAGFKVYVYPEEGKVSELYSKILQVIRDSRYFTTDPTEACIFVLAIDTLDRDTLSIDYSHNVDHKITQHSSTIWNNGKNHLIFNLYSGTFPDYNEDLKFNIGQAMLAKASMSVENFRQGFDISLPLFPKSHQLKGVEKGSLEGNTFPPTKKYLLVFKGKRYVYGIGSETRNSLFHLHNGKDVVLVTTCKHNKDWKKRRDDRCDEDQDEFDKYDFRILLQNSTFCLVPRGRRLGSFRYLEALQSACIPVLLSNDFELPFSDIINWSKAVLWADERLLLQVNNLLRSISPVDILSLQQHTQFLWETYFSSVEAIVSTTFEIIRDRVDTLSPLSRSSDIWNSIPGGLAVDTSYSDNREHLPFYSHIGDDRSLSSGDSSAAVTQSINRRESVAVPNNVSPHLARGISLRRQYFTAVVYSSAEPERTLNMLRQLGRSKYVGQVLLVSTSSEEHHVASYKSALLQAASTRTKIHFQLIPKTGHAGKFYPPSASIIYDGVFSVSDECSLVSEEFDFAFTVWQQFPDRLVGYLARSHYWKEAAAEFGYSSKYANAYSIILLSSGGSAGIYHKYYQHLVQHYLHLLPAASPPHDTNHHATAAQCDDLLINFLISHCTKLPPIKLSQRHAAEHSANLTAEGKRSEFKQQQHCLSLLRNSVFGYVPLVASALRLDPVLYKDSVSRSRKRYNRMESVQLPLTGPAAA